MPAENSPVNVFVNRLLESHANSEGPVAELIVIGRQLAYCQRKCGEWGKDGCQRFEERREWELTLITPGRTCDRMPK